MAYLARRRESWLRRLERVRRLPRSLTACIPAPCPLCGCRAAGGHLCACCARALAAGVQAAGVRCPRCCLPLAMLPGTMTSCPDCAVLRPAPAFERIIAAFDYADPGDLLIHRFKSGRRFTLAPMLAALLADAVQAAGPPLAPATILVPVPARRAAIIERGFHPAGELAHYLGRRCAWRCEPALLRRVHEGVRQATLPRPARLQAARLYACSRPVAGMHVAVVDDVLTTGGTLHGAALALKAAGAASVTGLVLARTPRSPGPRTFVDQSN